MSDTSTVLAVRRPSPIASGYNPPPSEDEFRGMIYMAKQLAEAQGFVPQHFYREPNKILAAMLYGRDLGITPTNALQHIIVIEGKATADAQLMGMLVRRAGHRLEDKTTADASTVTITRGDDGSVHTFTFTMQDAQRAGLVRQGSAWQKYPQAMLFARALTGCARKGAQDALMGVAYTPEELGAEVQVVDGEAVVVAAPGVSEAAGSPPAAAIQPTPPAPPVEVTPVPASAGADEQAAGAAVSVEGAPSTPARPAPQPDAATTPPSPQTPANAVPVAPLAGANISRRLGPGRSISPVRRNVTTVEAPTAPATVPEAPAAPAPQPDPVPSQPAAAALTDEPVLPPAPEPEDPGKAKFLNDMRGDLRVQTATLFRVNALLENVKRGLEGKEALEVPRPTPSEASDQALAQRIDADWPGRTLANLGESELTTLMERFESNLAKKRQVLKERGISEE